MDNHLEWLTDRRETAMAVTEWPEPSTDDLDLTTLPARLDDGMLARVERIAKSPLPALPSCDSRHLGQSLRMMLAVLPRRGSDDIAGELFVAAYERALSELLLPQIDFVRDEAIKRCRWFPTVAECLEIAGEWRRSDEATRRKYRAQSAARNERFQRGNDREREREVLIAEEPRPDPATMHPTLVRIGVSNGWLISDESGVRYSDEPA